MFHITKTIALYSSSVFTRAIAVSLCGLLREAFCALGAGQSDKLNTSWCPARRRGRLLLLLAELLLYWRRGATFLWRHFLLLLFSHVWWRERGLLVDVAQLSVGKCDDWAVAVGAGDDEDLTVAGPGEVGEACVVDVGDQTEWFRLLSVVQHHRALCRDGQHQPVGQREHGGDAREWRVEAETARAAAHCYRVLVRRWQVQHRPERI